MKKIKQLEIVEGAYTNKDGSSVHNDALALYITVNPRSFIGAQRLLIKKLADTLAGNHFYANPSSMAFSCIQKAKSRTVYVDFDFDKVELENTNIPINEDAYVILKTRGGFHVLVDPLKVVDEYKKNWYNSIKALPGCDVNGDNLIPVPGCTQGGFSPKLLK